MQSSEKDAKVNNMLIVKGCAYVMFL